MEIFLVCAAVGFVAAFALELWKGRNRAADKPAGSYLEQIEAEARRAAGTDCPATDRQRRYLVHLHKRLDEPPPDFDGLTVADAFLMIDDAKDRIQTRRSDTRKR